MRVTTRLTIDMSTGEILSHDWYDYTGPVALAKGDKTAKASEVAQANFQNTLTKAFKTQFANQQGILSFLQKTLEPGIQNPQGFDQATKAALNSSVINQSATDTQNAIKATQAQAAARGGATSLPSGVQEQIAGQINASGVAEKDAGLSNIQLQDQQLKEQNYWNSINALNGVSAQVNPLGYAGGANNAADSVAGLSNAYTNSNQSQLLGALGGIVGGVAGGVGSYFGSKRG